MLVHHGRLYFGDSPLAIINSTWEGIWLPMLKTFKELSIDLPEFESSSMASCIVQIPIDRGEPLQFLITVRKIVESEASIDERITGLEIELVSERWQEIRQKLRMSDEKIIGQFLPFIKKRQCGLILSRDQSI